MQVQPASGKKSESAHRTSGNISVAPMSQAPRYLPKPSGKSVTGARGKPEKSWITPKFSQEDDGRSPLPTVLERHLSETDLSSSEDDATSQLDVEDQKPLLMSKEDVKFDTACSYLKCSEKPLEVCLPETHRRSMYSLEIQDVFKSPLSKKKCARREATDFRNLEGQYLKAACEVMKCHESEPVKSCFASLSKDRVKGLKGREKDYIASSWHDTCTDRNEDMLEEICQKMGCQEDETLQSCETRRKKNKHKYTKTPEEAAYTHDRPRAVCENAAVKRPDILRAVAATAAGALVSLGSMVIPRRVHDLRTHPTAASLEESERLETLEDKLKYQITTANKKVADLKEDIQKYKNTHFMSSSKPVDEWKTQIAEIRDESRSWRSRLDAIGKRLRSLNAR